MQYLERMTATVREQRASDAVVAFPPPPRGEEPEPAPDANPLASVDPTFDPTALPQARRYWLAVDDHLSLCARLVRYRAEQDQHARHLAQQLQGLARELHEKDLAHAKLVGRARALEEQLAAKPRDAQLAALEQQLQQEGKRAKELELELDAFLDERRSCRLETNRVTRAESKAAGLDAKLLEAKRENDRLRTQLLCVKRDLAPDTVAAMLSKESRDAFRDVEDHKENTQCAQQ